MVDKDAWQTKRPHDVLAKWWEIGPFCITIASAPPSMTASTALSESNKPCSGKEDALWSIGTQTPLPFGRIVSKRLARTSVMIYRLCSPLLKGTICLFPRQKTELESHLQVHYNRGMVGNDKPALPHYLCRFHQGPCGLVC